MHTKIISESAFKVLQQYRDIVRAVDFSSSRIQLENELIGAISGDAISCGLDLDIRSGELICKKAKELVDTLLAPEPRVFYWKDK